MHITMNEISVGAVVFRKPRNIYYLLLHYEAGHWDFPKGIQEKDETPQHTARREIQEETGITKLEFIAGFKKNITYFFRRQKRVVFKKVTYFLAKTPTRRVTISTEHQGYAWLPYEEALNRITFKNSKDVLRSAHKVLTKQPAK